MSTITASDAQARFGDLLGRVAGGEEVVITRHRQPVARLVPISPPAPAQVLRAVAGLRALRTKIQTRTRGQKPLAAAEVRAAIAEGRR